MTTYSAKFSPVSAARVAKMAHVFRKTPVGAIGGYPLSIRAHYELYAVVCGTERRYSTF